MNSREKLEIQICKDRLLVLLMGFTDTMFSITNSSDYHLTWEKTWKNNKLKVRKFWPFRKITGDESVINNLQGVGQSDAIWDHTRFKFCDDFIFIKKSWQKRESTLSQENKTKNKLLISASSRNKNTFTKHKKVKVKHSESLEQVMKVLR